MAATAQAERFQKYRGSGFTELIYRLLLYLAILIGAVIFAMPFYWMIRTAVMPKTEVYQFPPLWIPSEIIWSNFQNPFKVYHFERWFLNTIIIAVTSMIWARITTGSDAEYQAGLFDEYPVTLARSPLWSTRGNHDLLYAGASNDYYDLFTLPTAAECGGVASATEAWYSFDWGPVHFVCLDSEGSDRSVGSPMLRWLRADLSATSQPWVVGFWHHPPYTKGSHDSDNIGDSGGIMFDMRQNIVPILESHGVDLVLCGHSHSYERSFLINGHYGISSTFDAPTMRLNGTSGQLDAGTPYTKPGPITSNMGTVYAVCGVSGKKDASGRDYFTNPETTSYAIAKQKAYDTVRKAFAAIDLLGGNREAA